MQSQEAAYNNGLDLGALLVRVGDDRELLQELLAILEEEYPRLERELQDACGHGDWKMAKVHAHTIKGMLANLSFWKASSSAQRIEQLAAVAASASIPPALILLNEDTALARAQLEQFCRQGPK
jgi:HPt (histidine-containing phosphotransfer) domain-containing protein